MKTQSWIILVSAGVIGACVFFKIESDESNRDLQLLLEKEKERLVIADDLTANNAAVAKNATVKDAEVLDETMLDKRRQETIWDLEHSTFELEWKFGKIVKDAIRNKSRAQLEGCFLTGSVGELPSTDDKQAAAESWWHQHELTSDHPRQQATAREVAEFLLKTVADFREIKKVSLRVLQIDRDEDQTDQYDLTILLSASGSNQDGPVSMTSTHQLAVQFANDEEIAEGTIIKSWEVESITQRGANQALFTEVTEQYGLDDLDLPDNWHAAPGSGIDSYTCQIAVDDFDNDGFLDIAVSSIQGRQYLLRSVKGKSFQDITRDVGLPETRLHSLKTVATWIDYDNDGFSDLLIGKTLYHNEQGKRLTRAKLNGGLKFDSATMGAVVVDYDGDGWLDLYVLNHMGSRKGHQIGFVDDDTLSGVANQLWRNLGNGSFADVTEESGIDGAARHSFAATWFHANEDEFPDLYLVNDFGRNCFFINRGDGHFDDITDEAGVGDFANSMGAAAGDLDNDGVSEIYVANMFSKMGRRIISHVGESDYPEGVFRGIEGACAGSHLYRRSGSKLEYEEISVEKSVNAIGWAYAPVMADFDADGLLDIYATSGFISVNRRKPDG